MSKEDLEIFSDIEILDLYDNARERVSYFNAGDGAPYAHEAAARRKAKSWMLDVREEVEKRALIPRKGDYLL